MAQRLLRALFAGVVFLTAAVAATAPSHVFAADAPPGIVAKGQLVLQTSLGGTANAITIGGDIAFEQSQRHIRVDVLSLGIPGMDPTLAATLSTQLIPPGGFTFVLDLKNGTTTYWSTSKRTYYQKAGVTTSPSTPAPAPTASAGGFNPTDAFGALRGLADDKALNISISLAGHSIVNGHPATGVDFQYTRTTQAGQTTDIHGRLQSADDLGGMPVELTASGTVGALPPSAVRLDLTSFSRQAPAEADFEVPPGFTRVNDLGGVIGRSLPKL